jgi:glycosyltransferase involved in cell wall biosynthesis
MRNDRPRVSVCIAAYQGEKYIAAQLRSILEQISEQDEVIVVDDASQDRTLAEIRSFADPRIRLIERPANQGVAKTFEEALSYATGNLVFLSDQDDIWMPRKVARTLQEFENNPSATLVVTDAALIDESGNDLGASYYAARGSFHPGFVANLLRSKYLGCTMAFRSELVKKILPFPHGLDVLHDLWIGMVNSVSAGTTLYIDEPLVRYRRHSAAVTGGKLSRKRQLTTRLDLFRAVTNYWVSGYLGRRAGA